MQGSAKLGQDFIEDLLANISNEQALSEGLEQLTAANKGAYQQAIDNLHSQLANHQEIGESQQHEPSSRLDDLLRKIS